MPNERKEKMKAELKAVFCLVLILCVVSGMWSCAKNDPNETTEPESTTYNYIYSGTFNFSTTGESELVQDEPLTETDGIPDGETVVDLIPANTERDTAKNENTTQPQTKNYDSLTYNNNKSVSVVLPDGATMADMFAILDANGVASFSSLMNTALNMDFTQFPLIGAQAKTGRAFVLEGYLRSGVYTFSQNTEPANVISRLLRSMESFVSTAMRRQISSKNMTIDDVLIIASLIETESNGDVAQMAKISAVIQNRLKAGMQLELSSTARYVDSVIRSYVHSDDPEVYTKYSDCYNTFRCAALPAGPICSPGSEAVKAAINPLNCDYLYFCVGEDGVYRYASTAEEHKANQIEAGLIAPEQPEQPTVQ